jgi:hypothetical protein
MAVITYSFASTFSNGVPNAADGAEYADPQITHIAL